MGGSQQKASTNKPDRGASTPARCRTDDPIFRPRTGLVIRAQRVATAWRTTDTEGVPVASPGAPSHRLGQDQRTLLRHGTYTNNSKGDYSFFFVKRLRLSPFAVMSPRTKPSLYVASTSPRFKRAHQPPSNLTSLSPRRPAA